MRIQTWAGQHALLAYFGLAFLIPWVLWGILIATTPPGELLTKGPTPGFLILAILGGLGPSMAGLIITGVIHGRAGIQTLLAGIGRARVSFRWYGAALLTIPIINVFWFFVFSVIGFPLTMGNIAGRLAMGLTWPLFAALGEEIGWRGFALPRLQSKCSPLSAALIIGLLWGLWHLPADYLGIGDQGWLFFPNFLLLGPVLLTAYSIIMTWVYNRTQSLLLILLFHYSITFSAIVLTPQGLSGLESLRVNGVSAAITWAVAVAVILSTKKTLGKKPPGISNQHLTEPLA